MISILQFHPMRKKTERESKRQEWKKTENKVMTGKTNK